MCCNSAPEFEADACTRTDRRRSPAALANPSRGRPTARRRWRPRPACIVHGRTGLEHELRAEQDRSAFEQSPDRPCATGSLVIRSRELAAARGIEKLRRFPLRRRGVRGISPPACAARLRKGDEIGGRKRAEGLRDVASGRPTGVANGEATKVAERSIGGRGASPCGRPPRHQAALSTRVPPGVPVRPSRPAGCGIGGRNAWVAWSAARGGEDRSTSSHPFPTLSLASHWCDRAKPDLPERQVPERPPYDSAGRHGRLLRFRRGSGELPELVSNSVMVGGTPGRPVALWRRSTCFTARPSSEVDACVRASNRCGIRGARIVPPPGSS